MKLNQVIAIISGKKTQTQKTLTDIYHNFQKPTLFDGISRTYEPLDEDGETQPPEKKLVQYKVYNALSEAKAAWTALFDIAATQDFANCLAKSDIVVDGVVVAKDVPVTYLLFLEKQLIDVQTLISKLPSLDPVENWTYDNKVDCWVSEQHKTNKSKKVMRNHVKAEATTQHPAQVETYTEDVKIGEWSAIKYSGAIPVAEQNWYLGKISKLIEGVKFAREAANNTEVLPIEIGKNVLSYIFDSK